MISLFPDVLLRRRQARHAAAAQTPVYQDDESHEARAERFLARLEAQLAFRNRVRTGLRVVGLVVVPLLVSALLMRQARA